MATISKTSVDANLRNRVFAHLFSNDQTEEMEFEKINDRQWGVLITDMNGNQRYVRIGAIVAEEREDATAEELMLSEIAAYRSKQDEKAEKAKAKAAKIERDKKKREEAAAKKKQ